METEKLKSKIRDLKATQKKICQHWHEAEQATATLSGENKRLQAEIERLQAENKRLTAHLDNMRILADHALMNARNAQMLLQIQRGNVPANRLQVIRGGGAGIVEKSHHVHIVHTNRQKTGA